MSYDQVDILLVEDNLSDAKLTLRALQKQKISDSIVHLKDGEEALDFIFARNKFSERNIHNKPKIILLDLKLPKISGLEILKQVKNDENTRHIPVVVLTSSKEEKDIIESYTLGVNSYIVKPVDFQQFSNSIKEIGPYWLHLNERPY